MLRPKIRIAIYGLFLRGVCLYVGQSVVPRNRFSQDCREHGIPRDSKLRVLRWTTLRSANRLEKEFIAKYKAKGQALFNKRVVMGIKVEGFKRPFRGWRDASQFLRVRATTLQRAARTGERANLWLLGRKVHVKTV